jgi:hypothetical protein
MRDELVAARFQEGADFQVVINFAVEDDHGVAVFGNDRLIAGGEVQNFQASSAKRDAIGLEDTLLIRATVNYGLRGL